MSTLPPFYLRVILVRHGQSANNALVESGGWPAYYKNRTADAPLTEIGREQAKRVGIFLSKMAKESPVPIKRFYTSCMTRALETSSLMYEASTSFKGRNSSSNNDVQGAGAFTDGVGAAVISLLPRPSVFVDAFEIGGLFDKRPDADMDREPDSNTWMGISGLSREGVTTLFPAIDLGDESLPPILPSSSTRSMKSFIPDGSSSSSSSRGSSSGSQSSTTTMFSPYTTGVLSNQGWYMSKRKEDESEGAARTIKVVEAFKALAVSLLVNERGEGADKDVKKPLGVGVTPDGSQVKKHDGEAIILVCHGDFINVFLRACVGDPSMTLEAVESKEGRGEGLQFAVNNCSCSIVDFLPGDSTVRVIRVNDVRGVGDGELEVEELLTGAPR